MLNSENQQLINKPPTLRASNFKQLIRIKFLSPYLKTISLEDRTLDLGCGWGFYFKHNPNAYGIDADEKCVSYLKEKGYQVQQGNILEDLPYEDNYFDNIFSHDVLEHFELSDTEKIFQKVHKVLKPGGLFMNIIPNKLGFDHGIKINAGHVYYMTPKKVKELAEQYGYCYEECYASPLPSFANYFYTHNKWITRSIKL